MTLAYNKGDTIAIMYDLEGKKVGSIGYIDEDKMKEGETKLDKIRINNKEEIFFPEINDFKKTEQVDRIYITGETGCGKSTFIQQYVLKFIKKFPDAPVLLFSSKSADKALDNIKKISRVEIDDDIYINPYTLNEISSQGKPILCIFDDIEDFKNKKINKEVERLRDEIMRNGRSFGIYSIFVHHNPCDYKSTRNMIFEANKVVIFPKRSGQGTYNYLMEKKLLLNKETIELLNNLKSKYVCINKQIPKSIVSDKYIMLL